MTPPLFWDAQRAARHLRIRARSAKRAKCRGGQVVNNRAADHGHDGLPPFRAPNPRSRLPIMTSQAMNDSRKSVVAGTIPF